MDARTARVRVTTTTTGIWLTPQFDPDDTDSQVALTYETLAEAFETRPGRGRGAGTGAPIAIPDGDVAAAFADVSGEEITMTDALDRVYTACVDGPGRHHV